MTERDTLILALHRAGQSRRGIGRQVGLSHVAVGKALRRLEAQRKKDDLLQALWMQGWHWSQQRQPVGVHELRDIGAKLQTLATALRQGGNRRGFQIDKSKIIDGFDLVGGGGHG